MAIILGIDPGSRKTGFGVINQIASGSEYIASGVIRLESELLLPEKLTKIFEQVSELICLYCPQEFAIEQVFMAKNASSALKLGQARGAAIVAAGANEVPVFEYEARKVKQSVVGKGAATKDQVQIMVKMLLNLPGTPQEDAADALAIALCHANTRQHMVKVAGAQSYRRGRIV